MKLSEDEMRTRYPELFLPDRKLDRRQCDRVVPMQVLHFGFMRTGLTCEPRFSSRISSIYCSVLKLLTAVQAALNILGYNCYPSRLIYSDTHDIDLWNKALDAKYLGKSKRFAREEWDQLLGEYSAVSDVPALAFVEDLIEAYPDAKVILVERDINKWFKSFNDTVIEHMSFHRLRLWALFQPRFARYGQMSLKWVKVWIKAGSRKEMREVARQRYREHYGLVRRVTPPERLLEFKLEDGWEPLCKFLDKLIPDAPFPRVNGTEEIKEKIAVIVYLMEKSVKQRLLSILAHVLVAFAACLLIRYFLRQC